MNYLSPELLHKKRGKIRETDSVNQSALQNTYSGFSPPILSEQSGWLPDPKSRCKKPCQPALDGPANGGQLSQ